MNHIYGEHTRRCYNRDSARPLENAASMSGPRSEKSQPGVSQTNVLAESMNKIVISGTRRLLCNAGLPACWSLRRTMLLFPQKRCARLKQRINILRTTWSSLPRKNDTLWVYGILHASTDYRPPGESCTNATPIIFSGTEHRREAYGHEII